MFKRGVGEGDSEGALIKKVRYEDDDADNSSALTTFSYKGGELVTKKKDQVSIHSHVFDMHFPVFTCCWFPPHFLSLQIKRTSSLDSPTMCLSGHDKAIYSISLDPTGQNLASSSFDKTICAAYFYTSFILSLPK